MPDYTNLKVLCISDTEPVLPQNWQPNIVWFEPSKGKLYEWRNNKWTMIYNFKKQLEAEPIEP